MNAREDLSPSLVEKDYVRQSEEFLRDMRRLEEGTKSKKINFSDIPELSDKQLSRMRRVGRPTVGDERRKLIAVRSDAKVSRRQRRH
jgi:hypothetical protein